MHPARYLGLALVLLAFAPMPAASAGSCVEMDLAGFGEGVGIYALTTDTAYGLSVASGIPEDGLTITALIAPLMCASVPGTPGAPAIGVPALSSASQDVPLTLPLVP